MNRNKQVLICIFFRPSNWVEENMKNELRSRTNFLLSFRFFQLWIFCKFWTCYRKRKDTHLLDGYVLFEPHFPWIQYLLCEINHLLRFIGNK